MNSRILKEEVIVIDSDDDDDPGVTNATEETAATQTSAENSPSMLSPEGVSYPPVMVEPRDPNFFNWKSPRVCKLEPTECSSAQYLERTLPTTSCHDATGYHEAERPQDVIEERNRTCEGDRSEISAQSPRSVTEMNCTADDSYGVVKCPVKKLRKRKLLTPPADAHQFVPYKRTFAPREDEMSSSKRLCSRRPVVPDNTTTIGSRITNPSVTLNSISQSTPVSVIKCVGQKVSNATSPDVTRASESDQAEDNICTTKSFLQNGEVNDLDFPVSSTPVHPQDNTPFPHSDSIISTTVKEEPSLCTSECTVRRKRKLFKSSELDTERVDNVKLPCFLDSNTVSSHTKKNSRTRLCFIMQLQAQGFALPHAYILKLIQEMMMAKLPSKRDIMYNILWSDSQRFPQAVNKDFLGQLFTTIIDSLMTTKYHHTQNANMALNYLLNIFCTDWRNSTMESSSYIATFLSTKIRQLLCEIRKFYERPAHLFCPHVASTLQQLVCLPLGVIQEPQRLSEFSQSMFNEVFVELSREKQKMFLNNLSSPYLTTQLIATQLTNDYVPLQNRDLLWSHHLYFIDSNWISTLLMLVTPYLADGREDLVHMIWLVTQLLAKFVQRQRGGVVLCAPICVTNPLLAIEPDVLVGCTSYVNEFLDRLKEDEVLCNTCLFIPEVCYHMKLMLALTEEKTTSNFDVWL